MAQLPPPAVMMRASTKRDASFDGIFYIAVRTTGIFCRPSCPAKSPRPENKEFYATPREALFAGYRPCLRCRPLQTGGAHPEEISRLLRSVDDNPAARLKDGDLRRMGLSPSRLRRYFLGRFGMTFHAYARSRRLGEAFQRIKKGAPLEDVILGHGYESHSGFRDAFKHLFGKPPGRASALECITTGWVETPLGPMVAASIKEGVCLLEFTDRRMIEAQLTTLRKRIGRPITAGAGPHLDQLREELAAYFAGRLRSFKVPLHAPGTPFQERVWRELLRIPWGQTRSYEEIARRIGSPQACRAVGTANGMNRIAIVIPCHRVVNTGGALGGYGGGLWRKHWMLELERGAVHRADEVKLRRLQQEKVDSSRNVVG